MPIMQKTMKRKILMIYPEFPTTYWSLKHALPFVNKKSSIIPLGLLTVASLLPADYNIRLVDMNVDRLDEEDVRKADLVFISAMIVQQESMDRVVTLCNTMGTPVVAGGPYPTSSHELINGVDHFVLNEAEVTLPAFIQDYEAGHPKAIYFDDRKPDITKTPPPRFDLIDINAYQNIALQNSRGCPYNCEFCDIIELFGRKPRLKDPDQFIREMDLVYTSGFRGSLFIVDDNFIGNKPKVKELLRKIIAWQKVHRYPFSLFTEASIDMSSDDELLELMASAGFDMVFIGIETPDADSLASCQKSQNLRLDLLDAIEKIHRSGIEVTGGFIVGFDTDREDIFDRQKEFIWLAGIPMAMVGLLSALPNTRLYRRLQREGRLKPENSWKGNNTHELRMSFKPVLPEETLVRGYKSILSSIYSPKQYFERCYTFMSRLPSGRSKSPFRIGYNEIHALFHSLFRQSFSYYGLHYLKFLAKALFTGIRHFPLAISFAVKGHHFFKMTESIIAAEKFAHRMEKARNVLMENDTRLVPGNRTVPAVRRYRIRRKILLMNSRIVKRYKKLNAETRGYLHEQFQEFQRVLKSNISAIKN